MKILYFGGISCGKSQLAEKEILKFKTQPIYLATTEIFDQEMQTKITLHKKRRKNKFIDIEEPISLYKTIKKYKNPVLIECVGMWINNMLYHDREKQIKKEIKKIMKLKNSIVFVLTNSNTSLVATDKLSRTYQKIVGEVSIILAKKCKKVFYVEAGLKRVLK